MSKATFVKMVLTWSSRQFYASSAFQTEVKWIEFSGICASFKFMDDFWCFYLSVEENFTPLSIIKEINVVACDFYDQYCILRFEIIEKVLVKLIWDDFNSGKTTENEFKEGRMQIFC